MSSTRLPGKVLMELLPGMTMLECVVARARRSRRIETVAVATSTSTADDAIAQLCLARGIPVFRGSESDVMGRVHDAAHNLGFDPLVRLTGDNPFIDGAAIDDLLSMVENGDLDYATTTHMAHSRRWTAERTFPRGVSMEVVRLARLDEVVAECADAERETPTFAIYDRPERFRLGAFEAVGAYAGWRHPELRMTVDTADDLAMARAIFAELGKDGADGFSTGQAIELLRARPELAALNAHIQQKIMADEVQARRDGNSV